MPEHHHNTVKRQNRPPIKVNATQVERFGHIANFLRDRMHERGWRTIDLNRALGLPDRNSVAFKWVNAQGGPAPKYRKQLAALFKVPEHVFMASRNGVQPVAPVPPPGGTPFWNFTFVSEHAVHVKVDAIMPVDAASELMKLLASASRVP